MAWIESHTVLIRHRKLLPLSNDLRLKPVYVLGHLHALWHAVLEQQEDGDLSSWPDDLISSVSCYQGDAPQYVSLLQKHGWLDNKKIHDWLDYAGLYLIKKYSTSNKDRLKEIWEKHGKCYGEKAYKANKKRAKSEQKESLPNQPNQPNQKENFKRKSFEPPTKQEVIDFCHERKNAIDPSKFFAYYESRDWTLSNGQKITDWRRAIAVWEENQPERERVKTELPTREHNNAPAFTCPPPQEFLELAKTISAEKAV